MTEVTGKLDLKGPNPFTRAKREPKKLKLLMFGGTGTGKTVTALGFPNPVVIDVERGTVLYGDDFAFAVHRTSDPQVLMELVEWLGAFSGHGYETVVFDGATVYWEALQKKWSDTFLKRRKGTVGYKHEFYDMQPSDWGTLKDEWRELFRKLCDLDMTVVVTAREKNKYSDSQFMKVIGVMADAEKQFEHEFDMVLRLFKNAKGEHMVCVEKARGRKLAESLPKEDSVLDAANLRKALGLSGTIVADEVPAAVEVENHEENVEEHTKFSKNLWRLCGEHNFPASRVLDWFAKQYPDTKWDDRTMEQTKATLAVVEKAIAKETKDA